MANRRMFSLDIVDSDNFLDMPSSSRCLYYDLGMRADDDGFVNPKKVIKLTSAGEYDLRILIAKGFVSLHGEKVFVAMEKNETATR